MTEPIWEGDRPAPRRSRPSTLRVIVVAAVVSILVTVVLNFVLVPAGMGWRKLEHEGTVTVHGVNAPLKVHYPSSFARPPSLSIEPVGNDDWFWQLDEQTESYFVITNRTVKRATGQPVHLHIKWKATGARKLW
jgi:hypothetical protein